MASTGTSTTADDADRTSRRRSRWWTRLRFSAAVAVPLVLAGGAVAGVAVAVPRPAGWIWLALAVGVVGAYVCSQIAGTHLYGWYQSDNAAPKNILARLAMEVVAMSERAADVGKVPSAATLATAYRAEDLVRQWRRSGITFTERIRRFDELGPEGIAALRAAHAELAPVVAPATPLALRFAKYKRDNDVFPFLGQVQLVRQMTGVAVVSLVVMLVLIPHTNFSGGTEHEAVNVVTLLAASALGGAFYALSTANRYLRARTFDPTTQPMYWSRFVLGLVAGGLLATLVPVSDTNAAANGLSPGVFAPPLLALLGGFSAEVVRQILNRLVETLQTVVVGRAQDEAERITQAAELDAKARALTGQLAMIRSVMTMEQALGPEAPAAARAALDQLYAHLGQPPVPPSPNGSGTHADGPPAPTQPTSGPQSTPGTPPPPGAQATTAPGGAAPAVT